MYRLTASLALFALLMVGSATAQPDTEVLETTWTWERPDETTVYLDFGRKTLKLWTIAPNGNCALYPGTIRWERDTLVMTATGIEWGMRMTDNHELDITFPGDHTVRYEPARLDPAARCDIKDGKQGA